MAQHIVGRHPVASNTVLNNADASRTHAAISWNGKFWLLQDTSSNGTYINGIRVLCGNELRLSPDDKINFANPDADTWLLLEDSAPKSMLIPETPGSPQIVLEDIAVLPSEDNPEIMLYLSPLGHWVCESEAGICALTTGDRVGTSEKSWRFVEAKAYAETLHLETQAGAAATDIEVHFDVSQNEEHVKLKFKLNQLEFDFGERNHHYLMLLLARQRIADTNSGFNHAERGWIEKDRLGDMLRLSETHINIQVYRFRKQIIKTLPASLLLPQFIERRSGEIRFVYDNIHISGGMQMSVTTNEISNTMLSQSECENE